MSRIGIVCLVVAMSIPCSLAAASPMVVNAGRAGAASASVAACDTDGFTLTYTTTAGNLTSVTIGGIARPTCTGASVYVTVVNTSRTSVASGGPVAVPSGSGDASVTVTVSPNPVAETPAGVDVSLVGP